MGKINFEPRPGSIGSDSHTFAPAKKISGGGNAETPADSNYEAGDIFYIHANGKFVGNPKIKEIINRDKKYK